jgi:outer membrane protein assembly factor BamD (BamD/ComL family)
MKKGIIAVFIFTTIISACASNQSLDEGDGEDLYNMGMDLLERGEAKKSIRYLKSAYELKKDSFGANLGLGDAYLKAGEPSKALPHFEYYISEYKEF